MSLFRSEEHLEHWLLAKNRRQGAIVSIEDVWRLAKAWYLDPRREDWRPRTRDESQAVLASVGLTDSFWTLPQS